LTRLKCPSDSFAPMTWQVVQGWVAPSILPSYRTRTRSVLCLTYRISTFALRHASRSVPTNGKHYGEYYVFGQRSYSSSFYCKYTYSANTADFVTVASIDMRTADPMHADHIRHEFHSPQMNRSSDHYGRGRLSLNSNHCRREREPHPHRR
jgi:hypothetical protein